MKGINPRGDKFIAHEVYCDAAQPIPDHTADMMNTLEGILSISYDGLTLTYRLFKC